VVQQVHDAFMLEHGKNVEGELRIRTEGTEDFVNKEPKITVLNNKLYRLKTVRFMQSSS
jgi:hypothetical protein